MAKPTLSANFDSANPLSFGPLYGLREGSGANSADDSPAGAPPLAISGAAAWATTTGGPVVRVTAAGGRLTAADAASLHRPTTAVTLTLGFSLSGTVVSSYPKYVGKLLAYGDCTWGLADRGDYGHGVVGEFHVGGSKYFTPPASNAADPANIALNQPYLAVLRWQSGQHPRCQLFDRATGTLVSDKTGTVDAANAPIAAPPSGSFDYDTRPLLIGYTENNGGDSPSTAFGDYEFFGVSDRRLTDAEVAAFVANPYANYSSGTGNYAFTGPASGLPGSDSSAFTVTLNAGVSPASAVTVTPSVVGMAGGFTPAAVSLSNASRSASFTFKPDQTTAAGANATISVSAGGGLADPAPRTFSASYDPLVGLASFRKQIALPINGNPASGFPAYAGNPGPNLNGSEHYDPVRCFYNARDYSGLDFSGPIATAIARLRDGYFLPYAGQSSLYHAYGTGMARHYYETGSIVSRDVALSLDPNYLTPFPGGVPGSPSQELSRETAFAVVDSIECEWLGRTHSTIADDLVTASLDHIKQWTRPAGQRYWATWTRPFMVALTCEALITYWERFRRNPGTAAVTRDGRSQAQLIAAIPAAVKAALDWMWDNCWIPPGTSLPIESGDKSWSNGSFRYTDVDTGDGVHLAPVHSTTRGAGTSSTFVGGAELSAQDDYFRYAYVSFVSGPWTGRLMRIGGYTGSTRTFTLDWPFDTIYTIGPGDGVAFTIVCDANGGSAANTGGTGAAPDLNQIIAPAFAWYYWYATSYLGARDNTYRVRHDAVFNGGSMCWGTATAQKQWNQATRWTFTGLDWRSRGDVEWPAAASYSLSAPATPSGRANVPSGLFKVSLPAGQAVPTSVKVTPSSGSGRGTFLPASAVLTNHRPYAPFRFIPDPADAGANVTINCGNDGGLMDPAGVPYGVTTAATVATSYAVTGPAAGAVNAPAAFTVSTVPAGAVLPLTWLRAGGGIAPATPLEGYNGNEFSLVQYPGQTHLVWVSSEQPSQAFQFTPVSGGAKSLTFNSLIGAPTPDPIRFAATVVLQATGYTLTPPASTPGPVGQASGAFTVSLTPAGYGLPAPATVTPSDGGAGGVFTPASVTLSTATPTAGFTYTSTKDGNFKVSASSGGTLNDPPVIVYEQNQGMRPVRFEPPQKWGRSRLRRP